MEVIVVVVVGSDPVIGGVDVETALATISGSSSADFQTPTATDFQELCTEIEDSTCGPSLDRGNKTTDTSHLVLDRTHLRDNSQLALDLHRELSTRVHPSARA